MNIILSFSCSRIVKVDFIKSISLFGSLKYGVIQFNPESFLSIILASTLLDILTLLNSWNFLSSLNLIWYLNVTKIQKILLDKCRIF